MKLEAFVSGGLRTGLFSLKHFAFESFGKQIQCLPPLHMPLRHFSYCKIQFPIIKFLLLQHPSLCLVRSTPSIPLPLPPYSTPFPSRKRNTLSHSLLRWVRVGHTHLKAESLWSLDTGKTDCQFSMSSIQVAEHSNTGVTS